MKKYRLSHLQKEYGCKLEELTSFLASHGYDYEELPNVEISQEAKDLIDFNFESKDLKKDSELPIEIKILEAVNQEKLLIERIIGFTDFTWRYLISTYDGECTQPIPFTSFDEVICEILLKGGELSLQEIGSIIGLDTENDPGAYEIMQKSIKPLKESNKNGDKMVDGDESALWLTELGIEYAERGVKYTTFTREFEIYWDIIGERHETAKHSLSTIKSERNPIKITSPIHNTIEQLRNISEVQSPEIHFPKKGFNLISANHKETHGFQAKVWVCVLENFRDNTTRAIVYDETQNKICPELSSIIEEKQELKDELIERLILNDESVVETTEEKPTEQKLIENELIAHQNEIDIAIANQESDKIFEIKNDIESTKIHYNTLEFELELKSLFDETKDDIWIISPWIKKYAFSKRKTFIENYLKKGGRVFIAYSMPESKSDKESLMVDVDSMNDLEELEQHYNNFYFCELPQFHYKNVWLRMQDSNNLYYNGSFNILSFFVNQNQKYVRQEKMAKHKWNNEIETEYLKVFNRFGAKYLNSSIEKLNFMCQNPPENLDEHFIKKLMALGKEKLKPFLENDILSQKLNEFVEVKEENILYFRKKLFDKQIGDYRQKIERIPNNKLSRVDKSILLKEFNLIREQNSDLIELQMKAFEVQYLLEKIVVIGKKTYAPKNQK